MVVISWAQVIFKDMAHSPVSYFPLALWLVAAVVLWLAWILLYENEMATYCFVNFVKDMLYSSTSIFSLVVAVVLLTMENLHQVMDADSSITWCEVCNSAATEEMTGFQCWSRSHDHCAHVNNNMDKLGELIKTRDHPPPDPHPAKCTPPCFLFASCAWVHIWSLT